MTKKLGLLGHDISYSKSPKLHKEIAKYLNQNIDYELYDLKESEIEELLKKIRNNSIDGINVTKPYKETVIKYLDKLTESAKKIGAVNTIYLKNGLLIGDNTDYDGFKKTLEINNITTDKNTVIILGSGGAAKACFEVLKDNYKPLYVSRDKKGLNIINYSDLDNIDYDLVIQATPIGTYPKIDLMPIDKKYIENKTVVDLIYNPLETKTMSYAKKAFNGTDMLIYQALAAQSLWFNKVLELESKDIEKIKKVVFYE